MSAPLTPELESTGEKPNWLPLGIAAALVIAVVVAAFMVGGRPRPIAPPVDAPADAYAAQLTLTKLAMSQATNTVGGRLLYIDGHIANRGNRTLTEITLQVVFRDYAGKVAQTQLTPLTVIGMREPYVDTAPLSKAPLAPGSERDFRLNFDDISPDWAGAMPELKVVKVAAE